CSEAVESQRGEGVQDPSAASRRCTRGVADNGSDTDDPASIDAAAGKPEIVSGTDPTAPAITVDGTDVAGPIREQDDTAKVSAVSAVPEVRTRITEPQRATAAAAVTGIVVEGRDIGTTVLPGHG